MSEQTSIVESTDFHQLLSAGFSFDEAYDLMKLKSRGDNQPEYREMLVESRRLQFVRWLVDHQRLKD